MFLIKTKPIIILANYRTGSSALCWSIGELNKIESFREPVTAFRNTSSEFLKQYYKNNNYVLKFMADQINLFKPYQELLKSDCFKIKLTRENKLDQITSCYIASVRNIWGTLDSDIKQPYVIPIYKDRIKDVIRSLRHVDDILDTIDIKFDMELTYEQLGTINHTNRVKTHQPTNIKKIKKSIKREMDRFND